jgi:peptidoglycan/LPS O-acetylase OafA/YrhL
MRRSLIGAVVYLAVMTLWIYGVANQVDPGSRAWQLPVLILIQLLAGLAIARWWGVLLPVVIVLLSIPAGYPPITPENAEPFPIWFGLGPVAPVAFLLIAFGVAARNFKHRDSSNPRLVT